MRASTIDWIQHANTPINSVDVQPRGYRILTGGSDNKVCIWNLLPIVSRKYELIGNENLNSQKVESDPKIVQDGLIGGIKENEEKKIEIEIDSFSYQEKKPKASQEAEFSDDLDINLVYKPDIEAMESLFDKEEIKSVRKLAELSNHEQPVNCVRWNSIGTFFASGGDDGRAILWEFKGYKYVSKSQDIFSNAFGGGGTMPISQNDFKNQEYNAEEDKIEIREDWQAKKIWRNHQSITDLTWAPDSLHFATCGTDSKICIMNINESQPLKIIESKANGLTFDPFGKFLASQSSEEKCVKIWRVQNFKNITEETRITSYFKQSMGMSINKRLSWSSDGSFISCTGGRVQGEYMVPLISRSSWNLMACLSGHSSSINISRINPKLYKAEGTQLNCFSIVAIVSQDSTISIWKPQLQKPFAVIMDFSMMGVTDLSWGFNGNILLSSSHDGKVTYFHFQPDVLGEPLSEFEKRQIISQKYGNQVLQEYIKNASTTSQQKNDGINQLSSNAQTQIGLRKEQEVTINAKTGKKKIIPKLEKVYDDSNAEVNPHFNPFTQLNDKSSNIIPNNENTEKNQTNKQNQEKNIQILDESLEIINNNNQQNTQINSKQLQQFSQKMNVDIDLKSQKINLDQQMNPSSNEQNNIQLQVIKSQPNLQLHNIQQQKDIQDKFQKPQQNNNQQIKQLKINNQPIIAAQDDIKITQSNGASQINVQQIIIQQQLQNDQNNKVNNKVQIVPTAQQQCSLDKQNKEFFQILKSIYDSKQELTSISLNQYQQIFTELMRDEIQIILPRDTQDMFSEEIRIFISNIQVSNNFQKIELKIYNQDCNEISKLEMNGEKVLLITANRNFFAFYTNKQLLHVFSSSTTELIKRGILLEGVCMIESNQSINRIILLTIKGMIYVYQIINPDFPSIDCVRPLNQISIQPILKNCFQKNLESSDYEESSILENIIYVQQIKLHDKGDIEIFLSDQSRYQYDISSLNEWRKMPRFMNEGKVQSLQLDNDIIDEINKNNARVEPALYCYEGSINQNKGQNYIESSVKKQNNEEKLSKLINLLEKLNKDENSHLYNQNVNNINYDSEKLIEMQDVIQIYENLNLKNEFINALRNYTIMVFQLGDFNKINDLFMKYSFIEGFYKKNQFLVNSQETLCILLGYFDIDTCLINGFNQELFQQYQNQKKIRSRIINQSEKKFCGVEKEQIFKQCILPVLKTVCEKKNIDIQNLIIQIINQISQNYLISNQGESDENIEQIDQEMKGVVQSQDKEENKNDQAPKIENTQSDHQKAFDKQKQENQFQSNLKNQSKQEIEQKYIENEMLKQKIERDNSLKKQNQINQQNTDIFPQIKQMISHKIDQTNENFQKNPLQSIIQIDLQSKVDQIPVSQKNQINQQFQQQQQHKQQNTFINISAQEQQQLIQLYEEQHQQQSNTGLQQNNLQKNQMSNGIIQNQRSSGINSSTASLQQLSQQKFQSKINNDMNTQIIQMQIPVFQQQNQNKSPYKSHQSQYIPQISPQNNQNQKFNLSLNQIQNQNSKHINGQHPQQHSSHVPQQQLQHQQNQIINMDMINRASLNQDLMNNQNRNITNMQSHNQNSYQQANSQVEMQQQILLSQLKLMDQGLNSNLCEQDLNMLILQALEQQANNEGNGVGGVNIQQNFNVANIQRNGVNGNSSFNQ